MNLKLLKDTLSIPQTRTYCVLDGAAVKDLPKRLFEMKPPNYCLLRGELTPDMVHVAPYVALMIPNDEFSNWVIENCFAGNKGIFVQTRFSIKEMRKHFRALVTVYDELGNPMLFRFYDPRVFRKFLPTCDADQVKTFFGNVDRFLLADEEEKDFLTYTQTDGVLDQKTIDLSDKE